MRFCGLKDFLERNFRPATMIAAVLTAVTVSVGVVIGYRWDRSELGTTVLIDCRC